MIRYLIYKVLNNFLLNLISIKSEPLLSIVGSGKTGATDFYFDLSDKTTHLGDRLFFIPLINLLVNVGKSVRLSSQDQFTNLLLREIYGIEPLAQGESSQVDLVVVPKPSFLNFWRRYPSCVVVDFTDDTSKLKISEQLVDSFKKRFDFKVSVPLQGPGSQTSDLDKSLGTGDRYYLFSNYINSGRFRKLFLNEEKLLLKCKQLSAQGYKIIHVGSQEDLDGDSKPYNFVDIDLRGKRTILDLIGLVRSEAVEGVVTYDNFLMHLAGIFHKKAFVLFRGRFSKRNYMHHMRCVNNTFYQDETLLAYL